jgi:hypothetical protein
MKLSELVAEFIKDADDQTGCSCDDGPERITLIVEGSSTPGFHYVYLDKDEHTEKYACAYQIAVHDGKAFRIEIEKRDPDKTVFLGPMYGFRRLLFQLYTAGTKLIIDGDANSIDTHYPGRNYD